MLAAVSPSDFAARVLSLRFGTEAGSAPEPLTQAGLMPFQRDAVERLQRIMSARGGAVLADSVGLGKTHIAGAIIRAYLARNERVLVCGPSTLAAHWRRRLGRQDGWQWLSHASLSRRSSAGGPFALVVVDEAHALRNPATRRYRNLAASAHGAALLLVTATPVNNSVLDFHHLVRLFADDGAFADLGVPCLAATFDAAARGTAVPELRRIVEAVVVRRTRAFVQRHFAPADSRGGRRLSFPRQEPIRTVHYQLSSRCPLLAGCIPATLSSLRFPAHAAAAAADRPRDAAHPTDRAAIAAELMRMNLVKRVESSVAALRASVGRHLGLLEHFRAAAADGFLLSPLDHRLLYRDVDGAVQLPLRAVALRPWPEHLDRYTFERDCAHDLHALQALATALDGCDSPDAKSVELLRLLSEEFTADSVLIFTEFRDTAVELWRLLVHRGGVALIHGGGARLSLTPASRRTVVERFAPVANGARTPRAHHAVRVLIATDVLSEGLNLQDARVVISYDMPWNPIRLAQRIGRIDRLGSPHDHVVACTFVPDPRVDALLQLMARVQRKLRAIRAVGGDAPRFRARHTSLAGEADVAERLRLEWRRRLAAGEHADHAATTAADARIDVARMPWSGAARAALCAVSDGGVPWLVLVRGRGPPECGTTRLDELLLTALQQTALAVPDAAWLAAAGRQALRAARARTRPAHGAAARDGVVRRASATVARWLRQSTDTATDAATADRILALLGGRLDAQHLLRIAEALRLSDDARRIAALARLATHAPPPPPDSRHGAIRLIAMLELTPAHG